MGGGRGARGDLRSCIILNITKRRERGKLCEKTTKGGGRGR